MTVPINKRFRKFLPVVVDVETAGVTPHTDALLEICAIPLHIKDGQWQPDEIWHEHIEPFEGANLEQESLDFIGMDPYHPFRMAKTEAIALAALFELLNKKLKQHHCHKAILVGHNAWFDLLFMKNAWKRCQLKPPFHPFSSFDTATIGGLLYGETVLAKVCRAAKIHFDVNEAHSAIYDAKKTAELFCKVINDNSFPISPTIR
jgi:ribonuclease T